MEQDLCSKVSALHDSIVSVILVNDGSIVQWKAKPGTKMPETKEMEGIAIQQVIMMSIARAHQRFLGKMHFGLMRYDDSDVLLFDLPAKKGTSLLIVSVKRPCTLDSLAEEIMGIVG